MTPTNEPGWASSSPVARRNPSAQPRRVVGDHVVGDLVGDVEQVADGVERESTGGNVQGPHRRKIAVKDRDSAVAGRRGRSARCHRG